MLHYNAIYGRNIVCAILKHNVHMGIIIVLSLFTTGYYFADIIHKQIFYCKTEVKDKHGLIILSPDSNPHKEPS